MSDEIKTYVFIAVSVAVGALIVIASMLSKIDEHLVTIIRLLDEVQ